MDRGIKSPRSAAPTTPYQLRNVAWGRVKRGPRADSRGHPPEIFGGTRGDTPRLCFSRRPPFFPGALLAWARVAYRVSYAASETSERGRRPSLADWRARMRAEVFWRKVHCWVSIVAALPLLVVALTGILLQVKKDFAWVQPTEQAGSGAEPAVSFEQIFAACGSRGGVHSWTDIRRLDFRPNKGLIKVTVGDDREIQIDAATGRVLQVARRRSDLIEALHDGGWFGKAVKRWVFLPAGVGLAILCGTGVYLFALPRWKRWKALRGARAEGRLRVQSSPRD